MATSDAPPLVELPGSAWSLWGEAALRSAGFPAHLIDGLSAPAVADAIDELLDGPPIKNRRERKQRDATALAKVRAVFFECAPAWRRALRALFERPDMREAMLRQNAGFVRRVRSRLATADVDTWGNNPVREAERGIALYAQRYCMKNESVGFYGPWSWLAWRRDGSTSWMKPGPHLIAKNATLVETWAADAIAETIEAIDGVRRWLRPRRAAPMGLFGGKLYPPFSEPLELNARQERLLLSCDGKTPACEIAERVAAEGGDRAAVMHELEEMRARGWLTWSLEPPMAREPLQILRAWVSRIEDLAVRRVSADVLDTFEDRVDAVTAASGDPDRLENALSDLDATFERLVARRAQRADGQTYAGRTLLVQQCERDVEVRLTENQLGKIGPPLDILLHAVRWASFHAAQVYRRRLVELHGELTGQRPDAQLDMTQLHVAIMQTPDMWTDGNLPRVFAPVQAELARRWAQLLDLPVDAREVHLSSQVLAERVATIFDAPFPGWSQARYSSPDLMLASQGGWASLSKGDFYAVLGEVHMSNTLQAFCGDRPGLVARRLADDPEPWVVPLSPKSLMSYFVDNKLVAPNDFRYSFLPTPAPPGSVELLAGDLVVVKRGPTLIVCSRDGLFEKEILEFLGVVLSWLVVNLFDVLPPSAHRPRVWIDDLVLTREQWRVPASSADFARTVDPVEQMVGARRWARTLGCPRRAFVKLPSETKPLYIDFAAPPLVDILARQLRRLEGTSGEVVLTEMLPVPSELWLEDTNGDRYTCEIRTVLIDPARPVDPVAPPQGQL